MVTLLRQFHISQTHAYLALVGQYCRVQAQQAAAALAQDARARAEPAPELCTAVALLECFCRYSQARAPSAPSSHRPRPLPGEGRTDRPPHPFHGAADDNNPSYLPLSLAAGAERSCAAVRASVHHGRSRVQESRRRAVAAPVGRWGW